MHASFPEERRSQRAVGSRRQLAALPDRLFREKLPIAFLPRPGQTLLAASLRQQKTDRPVDAIEPVQPSENEGGLGLLLDLQVRPVGVGPRRELGRVPKEPPRILEWLGAETRHGSEPQYGRNRSDLLSPHVFPHEAKIYLGGETSQAAVALLIMEELRPVPSRNISGPPSHQPNILHDLLFAREEKSG